MHDVSGALGAQPGMKQQTFIAETNCLNGWDTQQSRVFLPNGVAPTLAGADGGGGRNPAGLLLAAGFCAGAGPKITSAVETSGNNQAVLFENHPKDGRYNGPLDVSPTLAARMGTGGNNVPLVGNSADFSPESREVICISGNTIDREPENGGNGLGCQTDLAYTLTGADRHAVYSRQCSDEFAENDVVATQSARQHKDATDLVCEVAGLDCRNGNENGDLCGTLQSKTTGGYSLNNVHPVRTGKLIRRLTPLECERLQGFPDGWTDISGASDSARYKALGNSVAIPCVDFVLKGIAFILRKAMGEQ